MRSGAGIALQGLITQVYLVGGIGGWLGPPAPAPHCTQGLRPPDLHSGLLRPQTPQKALLAGLLQRWIMHERMIVMRHPPASAMRG